MRVVITGGGTGGHIYPALSIARQLRESNAEVLFVGSQHGPEGELATKDGLDFKAVPSGPIAGMSLRTAKSLGKLALGMLKAKSLLGQFQPDVVIGTGGYTSAAIVLAAQFSGIKTMIHEQNSVPGKTNLFLAKRANKVCLTFDESVPFFPNDKAVVTGLPVRTDIIAGVDRAAAREIFGLDREKFTVLVFGGSQGAKRINDMVVDAVPSLVEAGIQVLHQTGIRNFNDVESKRPLVDGYIIRPYLDNMAAAYSAADLVVSRSGASSIAEITVRGLASILIPYPFAHADHQLKNAEALAHAGAAVLAAENGLESGMLAKLILDFAGDREKLKQMAESSSKLGKPNAAAVISGIIESQVD